jgi:hypothetical protein
MQKVDLTEKYNRPEPVRNSGVNSRVKAYWKTYTELFLKQNVPGVNSFHVEGVTTNDNGDVVIRIQPGVSMNFSGSALKNIVNFFPSGTRMKMEYSCKSLEKRQLYSYEETKVCLVIPNKGAVSSYGDKKIYIKLLRSILTLGILTVFAYAYQLAGILSY